MVGSDGGHGVGSWSGGKFSPTTRVSRLPRAGNSGCVWWLAAGGDVRVVAGRRGKKEGGRRSAQVGSQSGVLQVGSGSVLRALHAGRLEWVRKWVVEGRLQSTVALLPARMGWEWAGHAGGLYAARVGQIV
jgi:hypothetical protein